MKKVMIIGLSIVFVFALTALSFSTEKTTNSAEKKASTTAEKKESEPVEKHEAVHAEKKETEKHISGLVTAVDAAANTLTVKDKKGEITMFTDTETKVVAGKEKKALADVKVGDKVEAKYTEADGKSMAKHITIHAAHTKHETKKATEPAEKKKESGT